jgi:putative transposase
VNRPPAGTDWVHEIKLDGYRMQLRVASREAVMRTRKGLDWTSDFAAIADAAHALDDCIIDGEVVARLDRLHLEFPFAGSRMLQGLLVAEGCKIGRRHVKTLMPRMGIEALYRRPRTTKPEPGHKIYPYLLREMEITRPNQVWAMDITYIPMARGFVYLAVVLDWFSRRVLSWRVSITMEAAFCVEALEDALAHHDKPDIFNTDQGSQFTGTAFTGVLIKNEIAISMDVEGAWRTTSSSSGCRAASNTRRCIREPMTPSAKLALRSVVT